MAIHPQAQAFLDLMAESGAPPITELSPDEVREGARLRELCSDGPEVESIEDIEIPGPAGSLAARVYEPSSNPVGTVVYLHGGGWVVGTLDGWDPVCRLLAKESGARVVSVDYRLAPEDPFPAAVDDAYAALEWVAEHLAGGEPVAVAGDSAGANLAAVCALRARDRSGPAIALQLLVYPVTDHDFSRSSYREHGDAGLFLGTKEMEWFWNHYVPNPSDRSNPEASPLRAPDLSGLPPAYVVVAEYDPLRDEGLAYARRLEEAGVPVTVRRFEDQIHVFFTMVGFMDDATTSGTEAAQAIRAALSGA